MNGFQSCPYACEGNENNVTAPIRILIEHLSLGHNHNYPYVCNNCKNQTFSAYTLKSMMQHSFDVHEANASFKITDQVIIPDTYPKGLICKKKSLSTHISQDRLNDSEETKQESVLSETYQFPPPKEAETTTSYKKEKSKRKGAKKRTLAPESPAVRKSSRLQPQESSPPQ